jgi:hypothetical protein
MLTGDALCRGEFFVADRVLHDSDTASARLAGKGSPGVSSPILPCYAA